MALVLFDRVKETSNTSGTGTIVLAGAVTGYQSFAVVGNANTTYYTIADQQGANWEVGIGTYYTGNVSLARTTIIASSNANAVVNFTNATHDVFVTYPAEKAVYLDSSNNASPSFGTFSGAVETLKGTGTNLLTYSSVLTNAIWVNNQTTTTGSQSDPFGGTTALLINNGVANNYHYVSNNITLTAQTYTLSAYVKAGTANYVGLALYSNAFYGAGFNLTTGAFSSNIVNAPISYTSTNAGNGWWRISITVSTTVTNNFYNILLSEDGTNWVYTGTSKNALVAAPQLEVGNILNTYIPTTTTAIYGTPTLSFSGVSNVTLDSTGTMNLSSGGASGFNFLNNATNYVSVSKNASLNEWDIVASNTSNLGLISTGGGAINFYTATGGVSKQVAITNTGSAVNYVQATGGVTGANVTISAQGSDANVGLGIFGKASGVISIAGAAGNSVAQIYVNHPTSGNSALTTPSFYVIPPQDNFGATRTRLGHNPRVAATGTDGFYFSTNEASLGFSGDTQLKVTHTGSAVNYVQATGGTTGNAVTVSAQGSDTNVSINLTPKGSGTVNVASNVFANSINITTETIRGTGQNLLTYSNTPAGTGWANNGITVTTSQTDPFGGTTAVLLNDGTSTGQHYTAQSITFTTIAYTTSFYAKAGTSNFIGIYNAGANQGAYFNLTTGAFSANLGNAPNSYAITNAGNGWWRISIVTTNTAASAYTYIYMSENGTTNSFTGTSLTVLVAAPQIEIGSTANTYIPTTTTAIYGTPTLSFSGVANVTLDSSGAMNLSSAGTGSINLNTGSGTQLKVIDVPSANRYVSVQGGVSGATYPAVGTGGGGEQFGVFSNLNSIGFYTNGYNGSKQFNITYTGSAVNYVQATGGATGSGVTVSAQGSDTNVNFTIQPKGSGAIPFLSGYGNLAFQINSQANNANYGLFTSTAAATSPLLQVSGADTNIDFRFRTQGTGSYQFDTGSNLNTQLKVTNTASAVNYAQVTGGSTGNAVTVSAQGSDTNVSINLTPKGTGSVNVSTTAIIGANVALGGATNPIVAMTGNANNYIQSYVYNLGNGAYTSADMVVYPVNGTDTAGWVDMGITGPVFNQAAYSVTGANEGYVFMSAPTASGTSGNLVFATDSTGTTNAMQWYTGGFSQAKSNAAMTLSNTGALVVKGSIKANSTGFIFPDGTTQTTAASAGLVSAGNSSIAIFNTNITANATIADGTNGLSVGPVNTANGIVVTVGANATWVVL